MKFNRNGISVFLASWLAFSMIAAPSLRAEQQVVPRGTTVKLLLSDSLSTKDSEVGQRFHATVAEDVIVDGRTMIRRGASLTGAVTEVERPKRLAGLAGKAKMTLRFDRIQTVSGGRPLEATLISVHDPAPGVTDKQARKDKDKNVDISKEGEVKAGTDVKDILTKGAIGVAAGAVLGAVFGNVSRGVLLGSIGGAVAILAPKGKDVNLREGTGLQIRLDRDLNLSIT